MALAFVVGAGLMGAASSGVLAPALAAGPAAPAAAVGTRGVGTQSSGMLNAVLPQRILDTRTTTGGHHGKLGAGATMRLAVLGQGGAPGAGVSAVLLTVTAVDETAAAGYLTVFRTGSSRPLASTLNYRARVALANLALVPVGPDGTVSIFNSAGLAAVVVDIEGWVGTGAATASGRTTTVTPARILDTRHYAPLGSGQSLTVAVDGAGGIPVGVSAVYADIIAVPVGNAAGYLTAYPSDAASPPVASTVSFKAGVATANLALLPVSATGRITITNHSPGANVIVDVAGWVSGGDVAADAGTRAIPVTRILDTRTSLGGHPAPVGAAGAVSVHVLGVGGVPSVGVAAVVVHVTGVAPTAGTYLRALATGYPHPVSAVLNLAKGRGSTVSNTAIVPVGPAGTITVDNKSGSLNVVVDLLGWIAAPVLRVAPPRASALRAGPLKSTDGERARRILTNANRSAMTTWWNGVYPSLVATPMKSEAVQSPEEVASLADTASTVLTADSVRRLSMEAFSLATSISAAPTTRRRPRPAPASRRRPPPPARSGSSAGSRPAISRTRRAAGARPQRARWMPATSVRRPGCSGRISPRGSRPR